MRVTSGLITGSYTLQLFLVTPDEIKITFTVTTSTTQISPVHSRAKLDLVEGSSLKVGDSPKVLLWPMNQLGVAIMSLD